MKKLLWCIACVGIISIVAAIVIGLNPDNNILGIAKSSGANYEEITVLKRNRTYEQLLRRKSDGVIFSYTSTWMPTDEDMKGALLAAHIGREDGDNYVTLKNKIIQNGKNGQLQRIDLLEPTLMIHTPDQSSLALWKEWRAKAKPFDEHTSTQ